MTLPGGLLESDEGRIIDPMQRIGNARLAVPMPQNNEAKFA